MYKDTNGKIFGNNVKRLRLERNLTLAQLSKLSKISKPYLTKIENGETKSLKLSHLDKLCKAFDVRIVSLLLA